MNTRLLACKIIQTLRHDGFLATLRKGRGTLGTSHGRDAFDVRHGTHTSGVEPLWKFRIDSPNVRFGVHYKATDEQELLDAIRSLDEDPSLFTFIDLGCGKGRTLLIAARLGFARIIGVEFAPELVAIAEGNLSSMCTSNATVVHGDAADFRFAGGNLVVYLYNPFSREVMEHVATNLRAAGAPRLYVIYKNPAFSEVFDGFLERFADPRPNIRIWRAKQPGGGRPSASI